MDTQLHSIHISRQVHHSSSANPVVRQRAAVDRRQTYVEIFTQQAQHDRARPPNPSWWTRPFKESADLIAEEFRREARSSANRSINQSNRADNTEFTLIHNDTRRTYDFDAVRQRAILIGRRAESDVVLNEVNDGSSRLQAVLYLFPDLNKVLLVDVGSLNGIKMLQRRSVAPMQHSSPVDRRNIELPWGEGCTLQMGNQTITIAPPVCIICASAPRTCRLSCGHFVTCQGCTDQLIGRGDLCPVCRSSIQMSQVEQRAGDLRSFQPR